MKNYICGNLILVLFFLLASCQSEVKKPKSSEAVVTKELNLTNYQNTENKFGNDPDDILDSRTESNEDSEPIKILPPSKGRSIAEEKASIKSIFLKLGCCQEEAKRVDDCCCNAVLEKYAELIKINDPKLGNYKSVDPILGKCKRRMPKEFELIDFPPNDGGGDDEDLF